MMDDLVVGVILFGLLAGGGYFWFLAICLHLREDELIEEMIHGKETRK